MPKVKIRLRGKAATKRIRTLLKENVRQIVGKNLQVAPKSVVIHMNNGSPDDFCRELDIEVFADPTGRVENVDCLGTEMGKEIQKVVGDEISISFTLWLAPVGVYVSH